MAVISLNIGANLTEFMASINKLSSMGKQASVKFEQGFKSNPITPNIQANGLVEAGKKAGGLFSSGFKSMFGGAFFGSMASTFGLQALTGIFNGLKEASQLAADQARVEKLVAQTIKSTGGVAGITAQEIYKMASSLQSVTNVGDEAILAGQAMLLTFTNIGKNIMPQATETLLNMATAMNSGVTPTAEILKGRAMQLGKALQDPVRGATALRKAGVSLTEQQLEQIKAFQESGDMLSAQKIILKELEVEFGGTARAMMKPSEQMKNSMNDFREKIGTIFNSIKSSAMPMLTGIFNGLNEIFGKASGDIAVDMKKAFQGFFAVITPVFNIIILAAKMSLPLLMKAFKFVGSALGVLGSTLKYVISYLQYLIIPVGLLIIGFKAYVLATWAANASTYQLMLRINSLGIVMRAHALWTKISALATNIFTAANWALVTSLLANPIVLIVAGIMALVAGIILAYKKSETFRNIIDSLWAGIKNLAMIIWNSLVKAWEYLVEIFNSYILPVLKVLGVAIGILITIALAPLVAAIYLLITYWNEIWDVMKAIGNWIATDFVGALENLWKWISDLASLIWDTVIGALESFYDFMKPIVVFAAKWLNITGLLYQGLYYLYTAIIKPFIDEYFPGLSKAIQDVIDWFVNLWNTIFGAAKEVAIFLGLIDDETKATDKSRSAKKKQTETLKENSVAKKANIKATEELSDAEKKASEILAEIRKNLSDKKLNIEALRIALSQTKKGTEEYIEIQNKLNEALGKTNEKAQELSIADYKEKMAKLILSNQQGTDSYNIMADKVKFLIKQEEDLSRALTMVEIGLEGIKWDNLIPPEDIFKEAADKAKTMKEGISDSFVNDKGKVGGAFKEYKIPEDVIDSFDSYNEKIAQSVKTSDLLRLQMETAGLTIENLSEQATTAISDSMSALLLGQEAYGKAMGKLAFDMLEKMVPIWSAQILGGSLATPDSILTGNISGIVKWTIATGLILGAVKAARAALGFKEGGFTPEGSSNEIAGIVHRNEFVANAELTTKYKDLFRHLHDGGTDYEYFEKKYKMNDRVEYIQNKSDRINVNFKHKFGNVRITNKELLIPVLNAEYSNLRRH